MSDIEEMNTSKDFSENDCLGKFYQRGCQEVLSKIYLNLTMESIDECRKVSKGWKMIMNDQKRYLERRIDHMWRSVKYTKYVTEPTENDSLHMEGLLASDKNYLYMGTRSSKVLIYDKQCRLVKSLIIHTESDRCSILIETNGTYMIATTVDHRLFHVGSTKLFIFSCHNDFALITTLSCSSRWLFDANVLQLDNSITYIDMYSGVSPMETHMIYITWDIPEQKIVKETHFRIQKSELQCE